MPSTKICQHCGSDCGCGGYRHDTIRVAYLPGEAGEKEKRAIHAVLKSARERTEVLLAEVERRKSPPTAGGGEK